jgi:general secretion pathway protein E
LYELLVVNEALARAISIVGVSRRGGDLAELKQIARDSGFKTIYEDGLLKARAGITSLAEVIRVAGR